MSYLPSLVETLHVPVVVVKTGDSEAYLPIQTAFCTLRRDLEDRVVQTVCVTLDPATQRAQKFVDLH